MRSVTITLEEEVARWARAWAASHNTSVSRLLGELLRQRMDEEVGYQRSMEPFLSGSPVELKAKGAHYPSRDELHE